MIATIHEPVWMVAVKFGLIVMMALTIGRVIALKYGGSGGN